MIRLSFTSAVFCCIEGNRIQVISPIETSTKPLVLGQNFAHVLKNIFEYVHLQLATTVCKAENFSSFSI